MNILNFDESNKIGKKFLKKYGLSCKNRDEYDLYGIFLLIKTCDLIYCKEFYEQQDFTFEIITYMMQELHQLIEESFIAYFTKTTTVNDLLFRSILESVVNIKFILNENPQQKIQELFTFILKNEDKYLNKREEIVEKKGGEPGDIYALEGSKKINDSRENLVKEYFSKNGYQFDYKSGWEKNIFDRFKKVGWEKNYREYYSFYSDTSHGNLGSIIDKIILKYTKNDLNEVKKYDLSTIRSFVFTGFDFYLTTVCDYCKFFNLPLLEDLLDITKETKLCLYHIQKDALNNYFSLSKIKTK